MHLIRATISLQTILNVYHISAMSTVHAQKLLLFLEGGLEGVVTGLSMCAASVEVALLPLKIPVSLHAVLLLLLLHNHPFPRRH